MLTWLATYFCVIDGLECQLLIINNNKDPNYYNKWNLRTHHNDDLCKLAEISRGVPLNASRSQRTHALGNNTKNHYYTLHIILANYRLFSLNSSFGFPLCIFPFRLALYLNFTLEETIMGGDLV